MLHLFVFEFVVYFLLDCASVNSLTPCIGDHTTWEYSGQEFYGPEDFVVNCDNINIYHYCLLNNTLDTGGVNKGYIGNQVCPQCGQCSIAPTLNPTKTPTAPTESPTKVPTEVPTDVPTPLPTFIPTISPTDSPTVDGAPTTLSPTLSPTVSPTIPGDCFSSNFFPRNPHDVVLKYIVYSCDFKEIRITTNQSYVDLDVDVSTSNNFYFEVDDIPQDIFWSLNVTQVNQTFLKLVFTKGEGPSETKYTFYHYTTDCSLIWGRTLVENSPVVEHSERIMPILFPNSLSPYIVRTHDIENHTFYQLTSFNYALARANYTSVCSGSVSNSNCNDTITFYFEKEYGYPMNEVKRIETKDVNRTYTPYVLTPSFRSAPNDFIFEDDFSFNTIIDQLETLFSKMVNENHVKTMSSKMPLDCNEDIIPLFSTRHTTTTFPQSEETWPSISHTCTRSVFIDGENFICYHNGKMAIYNATTMLSSLWDAEQCTNMNKIVNVNGIIICLTDKNSVNNTKEVWYSTFRAYTDGFNPSTSVAKIRSDATMRYAGYNDTHIFFTAPDIKNNISKSPSAPGRIETVSGVNEFVKDNLRVVLDGQFLFLYDDESVPEHVFKTAFTIKDVACSSGSTYCQFPVLLYKFNATESKSYNNINDTTYVVMFVLSTGTMTYVHNNEKLYMKTEIFPLFDPNHSEYDPNFPPLNNAFFQSTSSSAQSTDGSFQTDGFFQTDGSSDNSNDSTNSNSNDSTDSKSNDDSTFFQSGTGSNGINPSSDPSPRFALTDHGVAAISYYNVTMLYDFHSIIVPTVEITSCEATFSPTVSPTFSPSFSPTDAPAVASPTLSPTDVPTHVPTEVPTNVPTHVPTDVPTNAPTDSPSFPVLTPHELIQIGHWYKIRRLFVSSVGEAFVDSSFENTIWLRSSDLTRMYNITIERKTETFIGPYIEFFGAGENLETPIDDSYISEYLQPTNPTLPTIPKLDDTTVFDVDTTNNAITLCDPKGITPSDFLPLYAIISQNYPDNSLYCPDLHTSEGFSDPLEVLRYELETTNGRPRHIVLDNHLICMLVNTSQFEGSTQFSLGTAVAIDEEILEATIEDIIDDTNCFDHQYKSGNTCIPLTQCSSMQTESKEATQTSDRICILNVVEETDGSSGSSTPVPAPNPTPSPVHHPNLCPPGTYKHIDSITGLTTCKAVQKCLYTKTEATLSSDRVCATYGSEQYIYRVNAILFGIIIVMIGLRVYVNH